MMTFSWCSVWLCFSVLISMEEPLLRISMYRRQLIWFANQITNIGCVVGGVIQYWKLIKIRMCCVFILDFSISMPPHTYELTIYSILFILVVVLIFLVGAGTILLKCSKMIISWMPSLTKGSPCQAKQKEQFHGDKID